MFKLFVRLLCLVTSIQVGIKFQIFLQKSFEKESPWYHIFGHAATLQLDSVRTSHRWKRFNNLNWPYFPCLFANLKYCLIYDWHYNNYIYTVHDKFSNQQFVIHTLTCLLNCCCFFVNSYGLNIPCILIWFSSCVCFVLNYT